MNNSHVIPINVPIPLISRQGATPTLIVPTEVNHRLVDLQHLGLCLVLCIPVAWVLSHGVLWLFSSAAWPLLGAVAVAYVAYKVVEHVKNGAEQVKIRTSEDDKSRIRIRVTSSNPDRKVARRKRAGFCE